MYPWTEQVYSSKSELLANKSQSVFSSSLVVELFSRQAVSLTDMIKYVVFHICHIIMFL